MALFSRPAAAMSTILALTTSRYGDVYRRARASSSRRWAAVRSRDIRALSRHRLPFPGSPYASASP